MLLIGYQDQGNLGMGYLAATLLRHGRSVELVDVREEPARIIERVAARPPIVVGFSLIFQFFLPQFRRVAVALRKAGVTSHFTIGGHFPSLCPDEALRLMPELDSVVRYEGELTLVDLVERLAAGDDWRLSPGLAFLDGGEPRESEPRALVHDLDELPFPYRPYPPEQIVGFRTLPVLASRGCARRCSFCSIHTFYRTAPGKTVRVRRPEHVIEEMLSLWRDRDVRIFLFQDDDFPLWGRVGRRWADELVDRMHETGLVQNAIWKISCRAEYVEPELFAKLRDAGLFLVYMGIESGTESGPGLDGLDAYRADLTALTAASNEQLFQLVERSSLAFEGGENSGLDAAQTTAACAGIRTSLLRRRNAFFADNADIVTEASRASSVHGPVMAPQVH